MKLQVKLKVRSQRSYAKLMLKLCLSSQQSFSKLQAKLGNDSLLGEASLLGLGEAKC